MTKTQKDYSRVIAKRLKPLGKQSTEELLQLTCPHKWVSKRDAKKDRPIKWITVCEECGAEYPKDDAR